MAFVPDTAPRRALPRPHARDRFAVFRRALLEQYHAHQGELRRLEAARDTHDARDSLERSRRALRRTDQALAFIDMGIYGVCLSCGTDIPAERLEAVPAARRCASCERRLRHQEGFL